ncbi:MAG: hypothetical protein KAH23_06845 [Kiritimatiellae bacterium]|nr:hypothetical protein [Kiritimatiellia bacterium]
MFKKSSAIDRRRKKIQKELSSVHSNIKSLSKSVDGKTSGRDTNLSGLSSVDRKPVESKSAVRTDRGGGSSSITPGNQESRKIVGLHDERFADYLASNLDSMRPLRHVRRIQRNKSIATVIVVLVLILWLLYRYYL